MHILGAPVGITDKCRLGNTFGCIWLYLAVSPVPLQQGPISNFYWVVQGLFLQINTQQTDYPLRSVAVPRLGTNALLWGSFSLPDNPGMCWERQGKFLHSAWMAAAAAGSPWAIVSFCLLTVQQFTGMVVLVFREEQISKSVLYSVCVWVYLEREQIIDRIGKSHVGSCVCMWKLETLKWILASQHPPWHECDQLGGTGGLIWEDVLSLQLQSAWFLCDFCITGTCISTTWKVWSWRLLVTCLNLKGCE